MLCARFPTARCAINWSFSTAIRPVKHQQIIKRVYLTKSAQTASKYRTQLRPFSKIAEDMAPKGSSLPKPTGNQAPSERPMENEEWKQRPPYQIQTPEEFGPVKWQAKCQCGQVTYKISRDKPLKAKYCHCRGCQIMHGAPFQWAAIFHKEDLTFDKGAHGLSFYSSAHSTREYEVPTKVSCSFCRTPIMDEGRNVCLIFPEAIVAGDSDEERQKWRDAFAPDVHIFYDKRCIEILDGKTKWSGMDEESELVDDYGNRKSDKSE